MSGAQFPKIEPVPGYDDRFLMRVKGFCSAPAFGADARFPDAAKGRMQVAHHRRVAPDGAGSDAVLRRQYPVDVAGPGIADQPEPRRSEEHTSELQSLMRISYAVICLKK